MVSQGFPERRFPNHDFQGGLRRSELTGTPEPFRSWAGRTPGRRGQGRDPAAGSQLCSEDE